MTSISSSRRYAQAILDLAVQDDSLPAWQSDLSVLQQLWADPPTRAYFEDVHISRLKRIERARTVLNGRIGPLTLNLLLVLISRGRTVLVPFIVRQFEDLIRERDQAVVALVTSAQPLSEEQRTDLIAQLQVRTGKTVTLEELVDPEIIGGLVLRVGDQLMDLSIAGKLRRLREQVVGRAV